MSNKETLQNYNTRLSNNNLSLNNILDKINNLPSGSNSSSGSCEPNIFIQETEPTTYEGIWIQDEYKQVEEIDIQTELTTSVFAWSSQTLTNFPYEFNNGGAVSIGTDIYIFGGGESTGTGGTRQTVYKYDTTTDTYTQLTNIPYDFYDGAIGCVGTDIYLFGSINYGTTAYKYDTTTNTYTKLTNVPYSLVNGYAATVGTDIYLFTAWNNKKAAYKYDTLTNSYSALTSIPTEAAYARAASIGTDVYIFGSNTSSYQKRAYKYDTLAGTYTQIADIPYNFFNGACVADGENIYLLGSEVSGNKQFVYKYDPIANVYTQLESIAYEFWNGAGAMVGNNIYLFGGANYQNTVTKGGMSFPQTQITNGVILYSPAEGDLVYNTELFSNSNISNRALFGFNAVFLVENGTPNPPTTNVYYGDGTVWIECDKMYTEPIIDEIKLQSKEVTITENGATTITADEGFDGLGSVEIITNIPTDDSTTTLPDGYTQVEYIESTNTASPYEYINTGVTLNDVSTIQYDFKFNATSFNTALFGCYGDGTNGGTLYRNKLYVAGDNTIDLGLSTNADYEGKIIVDTVNKTGSFYANAGQVDLSTTYETGGFPSDIPFGLFCQYGPSSSTGYIASGFGNMKLYYFKMYLDGVLVRDFIPVYDEVNSVAGLYDLVNDTFYGNEGSGSFTYGEKVVIDNNGYIEDCSELFNGTSDASHSLITRLLPYCKPTTAYKMFYQNTNVTGAFDVTNLDVSQCLTCESMFENMTNVTSFDVSNFDTSACTNMQSMFIYFGSTNTEANKLDLTSFDTTNVTNMSYMFWGGKYISELDLSSFDFTNVTTTTAMFYNCGTSLSTPTVVYVKDETAQTWILNLSAPASRPSNWSTDNVIIKET